MAGDSDLSFLQMTDTELESISWPIYDDGISGGLPQSTTVSSEALVNLRRASSWFLAPESWNVAFNEPPALTTQETEKSLKKYVEQVQSWMRQWVTEGHSPLHHREIYSSRMPRHTQDAYTAMTMYMGKTRETEAIVHRILENRVSQLIQDQDIVGASGGEEAMSVFDHLSRVQALLCYQLIRLFDGDIRMRAQAEALIPTMTQWNKQMLEAVKDNLGRPERLLAASPFDTDQLRHIYSFGATTPSPSASKAILWHAWILAESVRRTWQTNVVQEVYLYFKRSWAECPGRLPTTMLKTLWDAPSAYAWTKELAEGERDPLLVSTVRLEALFERVSPLEVDEFNLVSLGLFGMEMLPQWLDGKGGGRARLLSEWENAFVLDSSY